MEAVEYDGSDLLEFFRRRPFLVGRVITIDEMQQLREKKAIKASRAENLAWFARGWISSRSGLASEFSRN